MVRFCCWCLSFEAGRIGVKRSVPNRVGREGRSELCRWPAGWREARVWMESVNSSQRTETILIQQTISVVVMTALTYGVWLAGVLAGGLGSSSQNDTSHFCHSDHSGAPGSHLSPSSLFSSIHAFSYLCFKAEAHFLLERAQELCTDCPIFKPWIIYKIF